MWKRIQAQVQVVSVLQRRVEVEAPLLRVEDAIRAKVTSVYSKKNSLSSRGGAQGHGIQFPLPRVSSYSNIPTTQQPINQWLSNNSGGMSPGPGAGPGLFGPSRFQSPIIISETTSV